MSAVLRQTLVAGMIALCGSATLAIGQQPGGDAAAPASQFQQRLAQIVQRQLGLTDAQLQQVIAVNKKYEQPRFLLLQQEREIRITIRGEVLRGDSADQARVSRLLDQMMKVQTQRLQILQSEQKDLSAFLTPVQRAKYLAIQEQVRKRLEQIRQRGADGSGMPQGQGMQGQGMRRRFQQQQQPQQITPTPPSAPPPESSPSA